MPSNANPFVQTPTGEQVRLYRYSPETAQLFRYSADHDAYLFVKNLLGRENASEAAAIAAFEYAESGRHDDIYDDDDMIIGTYP